MIASYGCYSSLIPFFQETKDENKMLMCDVCDKGCHTYCLRPPVTSMPKHGFKCERCRVCRDCGIRTLSPTHSSRWHLSYSVCDRCYNQRKKGNSCVICERSCREKMPPGKPVFFFFNFYFPFVMNCLYC